MTSPDYRRSPQARNAVVSPRDADAMLELVLTLDRMLVEVSMQLYGLSRREQSTMRKHHRRLHHAVREHLPRILKPLRRA